MRLIFILALLAFPIAEIWILINLAHQYGWWVLLYLVVVALLGLQLIRDEKLLFSGRMMQSLSQGGNPMKAVFGSMRNIITSIACCSCGRIIFFILNVILNHCTCINRKTSSNRKCQTTANTNGSTNDSERNLLQSVGII